MSMIYHIRHSLVYDYPEEVFLEPQALFLRPREDAGQQLHAFALVISPEPMLISQQTDVFGNHPARAWFREGMNRFSVSAVSTVAVLRANPFDYLIEGGSLSLPASYPPSIESSLAQYRAPIESDASVETYSKRIAKSVAYDTGRFLFALSADIHYSFKKVFRKEGAAWTPSETLEAKEGACRDLAVLFIECCRIQGLAARFASGYYARETGAVSHELHAWCEVYLDGGGWRGYDPSYGVAVSENHIPVASGPDTYSLAPVQGAYRGKKSKSKLYTNVFIQRLPNGTRESGRQPNYV